MKLRVANDALIIREFKKIVRSSLVLPKFQVEWSLQLGQVGPHTGWLLSPESLLHHYLSPISCMIYAEKCFSC